MDVKRNVKLSHFTPSAVPLLIAMSQFTTFEKKIRQVEKSASHYILLK